MHLQVTAAPGSVVLTVSITHLADAAVDVTKALSRITANTSAATHFLVTADTGGFAITVSEIILPPTLALSDAEDGPSELSINVTTVHVDADVDLSRKHIRAGSQAVGECLMPIGALLPRGLDSMQLSLPSLVISACTALPRDGRCFATAHAETAGLGVVGMGPADVLQAAASATAHEGASVVWSDDRALDDGLTLMFDIKVGFAGRSNTTLKFNVLIDSSSLEAALSGGSTLLDALRLDAMVTAAGHAELRFSADMAPLRLPLSVHLPASRLAVSSTDAMGAHSLVTELHLDTISLGSERRPVSGSLLLSEARGGRALRDVVQAAIGGHGDELRLCMMGIEGPHGELCVRWNSSSTAGAAASGNASTSMLSVQSVDVRSGSASADIDLEAQTVRNGSRVGANGSLVLELLLPGLVRSVVLSYPRVAVGASVALASEAASLVDVEVMVSGGSLRGVSHGPPGVGSRLLHSMAVGMSAASRERASVVLSDVAALDGGFDVGVAIALIDEGSGLRFQLPAVNVRLGGGEEEMVEEEEEEKVGEGPQLRLELYAEEQPLLAAVKLLASLPFDAPFNVSLPSAMLSLVSANRTGTPLMGLELASLFAHESAQPVASTTLLLSECYKGAVGKLLEEVLDARFTTVCIIPAHLSTADATSTSSDGVCVGFTSSSTIGPSTRTATRIATVSLAMLPPYHEATLPCIVRGFCAPLSRAELEPFPPEEICLTSTLSLPFMPLIDGHFPKITIDLWVDFLPVGHVSLNASAVATDVPTATVDLCFTPTNWYYVARLLADGQGFMGVLAQPIERTFAAHPRPQTSSALSRALPDFKYTAILGRRGSGGDGDGEEERGMLAFPAYLTGWPDKTAENITIAASSATLLTLKLPLGVFGSLPFDLVLPEIAITAAYAREGASEVQVLSARLEGGGRVTLAGTPNNTRVRTNVPILLTALADPGVASCLTSSCYSTSAPRQACIPCSLGQMLHSVSSFSPTPLAVTVRVGEGGDQGALHMGLTLNADGSSFRDSQAAFIDRSRVRSSAASSQVEMELAAFQAEAYGSLLHDFNFDFGQTLSETIGTFVSSFGQGDDGKNLHVNLEVELFGIFTVPLTALRLVTDIYLQDVDGVSPHAVLMKLSSESSYSPELSHDVSAGISYDVPVTIEPGEVSARIDKSVPLLLESAVRLADEIYMKDQLCMNFDHGVIDLTLQCEGSECGAETAPFALTAGFEYRVGAFTQRPCYEPLTCFPTVDTILNGDGPSSSSGMQLSSQAAFSQLGGVTLLDGAAYEVSSAFYQLAAPLLQGFTTSFNFAVTDPCIDGTFCSTLGIGCCEPLGGGFAFVVQADEAGAAAIGTDCSALVFTALPSVGNLLYTLDNTTRVSCAGYGGIKRSVGVLFSFAKNQFWDTVYDDFSRDSISVFVNGEVRTVAPDEEPLHPTAYLRTYLITYLITYLGAHGGA